MCRRILTATGCFMINRYNPNLFMTLPGWVNALLKVLYMIEISCFSFLSFSSGVSLLLILQKPDSNNEDIGSK